MAKIIQQLHVRDTINGNGGVTYEVTAEGQVIIEVMLNGTRVAFCSHTMPGEAATKRLAHALSADPDELLCLAGKVPEDVAEYLCRNPSIIKALRTGMKVR